MSDEKPRDGFARFFFPFFALIGVVSVASRFDRVLEQTPELAATALLFIHGPLLFVAGLLELRASKEGDDDSWVGRHDKWTRYAFTLSFTFLSIATLQVLDFEVGPIDPSPPESFPPMQRVAWYAMFSFGMGFVNYLAAVETLLPVLRFTAKPVRGIQLTTSVPVMAFVGALVATGLYFVLGLPPVQEGIAWLSARLDEPDAMLALIFIPLLLPFFLARSKKD